MAGSTTGFLKRIAAGFSFSRKTTLEEAQDTPLAGGEEEVEGDRLPAYEEATPPEPPTPTIHTATARSTTLKSPSRASNVLANPAKRKHASDAERQDLYDVPVGKAPYASEYEEPPRSRPAKRAKRNGRAKEPLTVPRTSSRYTSSHQPNKTKEQRISEREKMPTLADVPAPSPVTGDRAPAAKQPEPKKRGRPRKVQKPQPEEIHDVPVLPASNREARDDHPAAESVASRSRSGGALQAEGDGDEDITGIFLTPSPIKVVREQEQLPTLTTQQQRPSKPRDRAGIANSLPELSADEEELEGDAEAEASEEVEGEEGRAAALEEPRKTPFDPHLIERMWEISKRVGCKFDKDGQTWLQVKKTQILLTGPGKRMIEQLETLTAGYEALREGKTSRDKRAFRDAHNEVEEILNVLSTETRCILTKRLGSGPDSQKRLKETLTDLYFHLLPEFINALRNAVAAYNNQGSMETAELKEILRVVDLLHDLAEAAVNQPKERQPRPAAKSDTYRISMPTRNNFPSIRELKKVISAELSLREREEKRAEDELLRPEREKRLREEQERVHAEMCRKREERRRRQGESWWNVQNNHFPGPWNRILQADMARLEAASKGKGRQESVELGYSRVNLARSRCAYSQQSRSGSDQSVERVSVFPANNVKDSSMSSLSKEDTITFIDCMRYEQGKN
jgi:hypothetical protein